MHSKALKTITQNLLLAVIAVLPFVKITTLYFPFISGKAYLFRFFVALAFFFWVWLMLKDRSYLPKFKNTLVVALILFFLSQVLVSFFSVDPLYSFFSSIDRGDGVLQYGFWALYFLMLVSVFRQHQDWKKLFLVFIAVATALSIYSFFSQDSSQPDFSGRFGNPAYFGAFLLFAIGFTLITLQRRFFQFRNTDKILVALAGFLALTLILTTIRGVLAGFFGGIFLFCALSFLFLKQENRRLANICGALLLIGVVAITSLFAARNTGFVKENAILSRVTEVANIWEVPSVRERLLNWNIALKAFQEKPIFGWGPENYGVAANKYYDFRIGENEPWFDRAHSQLFDTLATGGLVLFSFYLFWIFAVFFLIFKVFRSGKKILAFTLASLFFAYLIQGFFLFDTLAVYLGLFPFLAYLVYLNSKFQIPNSKQAPNSKFQIPNKFQTPILVGAAVISSLVIYTTVVSWRANKAGWQFFNLTNQGVYKETKPYLQEAFKIRSPYTFWELRRMTAWRFLEVLESDITKEPAAKKLAEIGDLYDFLIPEFEKHVEARPTHPSMYHVLAEIYRLGFEKLGKDDLQKAEELLKKAFNYSDLRVEYFNDFAKVALLQGKFEEAQELIRAHAERMPPEWGEYRPFVTLGNFYFEAEKYEQALEQYDKAMEVGFQIHTHEAVYPRYMLAAESTKDYQRIVEMGQKYLEFKGPDADTYFNVAVGYFYLEDREKAREFFLKAVELKPEEYKQYRAFFVE